jgi:uncharacterized Zn finger protein
MGKIETLQSLLAGKFPEDLKDLFFSKDSGLFPAPNEIKLDCSCPDWATMCKHVAAVLYGVGARLDASPELFFTLRGVNMDAHISQAAKKETEKLLSKQPGKSSRIIQPSDNRLSDISALFGVSLTVEVPPTESVESAKSFKRPRKVAAEPKRPMTKAKIKPKILPKTKKEPATKA